MEYVVTKINIWYVEGLMIECCRKTFKSAMEYIKKLDPERLEEVKIFNFRCTEEFYNKCID